MNFSKRYFIFRQEILIRISVFSPKYDMKLLKNTEKSALLLFDIRAGSETGISVIVKILASESTAQTFLQNSFQQ